MAIKINGTNTTASPGITGPDTDTGLVYGTDEVQIVTGGTTRATVDSSGRVGIGTAAPASLLDVHTTTEGNVARFRASDDVRYLQISSFNAGANGSGYDFDATSSSGALSFSTTGSERLRIQSGGGISFNGDTAAANALDDYEEGTFTAVPDTANLTLNSNYTTWSYRKIGSLVHIKGLLLVSSVSGSNAIEIGGIPFNNGAHPSNGSSSAAGAVMYNGPTVGDRGLAVYIPGGADHIRFYKVNNNAGWSQLSNADLAANDEIHLSITYYV